MTFLLRCDGAAEAVSKDVARAIAIFFNKSEKSRRGCLFTVQEARQGAAMQRRAGMKNKLKYQKFLQGDSEVTWWSRCPDMDM